MNINATLLGQIITFALFVWFTMKFVWPHIIQAMKEREDKIADGLAAAERGHHELALAQKSAAQRLRQAKNQAASIVSDAKHQGDEIIKNAEQKARQESDRIIKQAQQQVAKEFSQAQQILRKDVASIAVSSAEKILGRSVDQASNRYLVDQLIEEL